MHKPETSPGEGNGNPLQDSCLENPMDRGAWQATICGVTKSHTQLSMHTIQMRATHSSHKHKAAADSTTSECRCQGAVILHAAQLLQLQLFPRHHQGLLPQHSTSLFNTGALCF